MTDWIPLPLAAERLNISQRQTRTLAAQGHIRDNGMAGRNKRYSAKSIAELSKRMEQGNAPWQEVKNTPSLPSMKMLPGLAPGSSGSRSHQAGASAAVPLAPKPPKPRA